MTRESQNFEMYEGEKKDLYITVYDEVNVIKDLSGYDIQWKMVQTSGGTEEISKTSAGGGGITFKDDDPTQGVIIVALLQADSSGSPGLYVHECRAIIGVDAPVVVAQGKVKVKDSLFEPPPPAP